MKESLDCDCGICSICNGLRKPNESHEDAALRRGTQPTDVQQLQAKIRAVYDQAYADKRGICNESVVLRVYRRLRELSAMQ